MMINHNCICIDYACWNEFKNKKYKAYNITENSSIIIKQRDYGRDCWGRAFVLSDDIEWNHLKGILEKIKNKFGQISTLYVHINFMEKQEKVRKNLEGMINDLGILADITVLSEKKKLGAITRDYFERVHMGEEWVECEDLDRLENVPSTSPEILESEGMIINHNCVCIDNACLKEFDYEPYSITDDSSIIIKKRDYGQYRWGRAFVLSDDIEWDHLKGILEKIKKECGQISLLYVHIKFMEKQGREYEDLENMIKELDISADITFFSGGGKAGVTNRDYFESKHMGLDWQECEDLAPLKKEVSFIRPEILEDSKNDFLELSTNIICDVYFSLLPAYMDGTEDDVQMGEGVREEIIISLTKAKNNLREYTEAGITLKEEHRPLNSYRIDEWISCLKQNKIRSICRTYEEYHRLVYGISNQD